MKQNVWLEHPCTIIWPVPYTNGVSSGPTYTWLREVNIFFWLKSNHSRHNQRNTAHNKQHSNHTHCSIEPVHRMWPISTTKPTVTAQTPRNSQFSVIQQKYTRATTGNASRPTVINVVKTETIVSPIFVVLHAVHVLDETQGLCQQASAWVWTSLFVHLSWLLLVAYNYLLAVHNIHKIQCKINRKIWAESLRSCYGTGPVESGNLRIKKYAQEKNWLQNPFHI